MVIRFRDQDGIDWVSFVSDVRVEGDHFLFDADKGTYEIIIPAAIDVLGMLFLYKYVNLLKYGHPQHGHQKRKRPNLYRLDLESE